MGYGLGPAANGAFDGGGERRPIAIIGDGGFWHNGLSSSFTNMAFNKSDGVAMIVDNYYSAATGGQDIMSSRADNADEGHEAPDLQGPEGHRHRLGPPRWTAPMTWPKMRDVMREALTTDARGPKVIVASSECMLNKQRREKPLDPSRRSSEGRRVEAPRFGVDENDLHRRSRLHPPVGLPVAVAETPRRPPAR
jgi:indolepyruvate ferredoxin oxidoreductase, alpha subunit